MPAEIAEVVTAQEPIVDVPNPIQDAPIETPPEPEKAEAKPVEAKPVEKPSIRDSIKAAEAKVAGEEKPSDKAEVKSTGKVEAKADPAKPVIPAKYEAPARFTAQAKAEWEKAPETVRAEVTRMHKELEAGFAKHKESAELFEPVRKYHEMAKAAGTTMDKAMERYVAIDQDLASTNPQTKVQAIEHILKVAGITPMQYAAYVSGQAPDQNAMKQDSSVRAMQAKIDALEAHISKISTTMQEGEQSNLQSRVAEWASDKPDVEDLADEIAANVHSGLSLDDAYAKAKIDAEEKARRLGFIPATQAPAQDTAPQPRRVPQSITGAPSPGSYLAQNSPSSSIKDALRRAMQKAG